MYCPVQAMPAPPHAFRVHAYAAADVLQKELLLSGTARLPQPRAALLQRGTMQSRSLHNTGERSGLKFACIQLARYNILRGHIALSAQPCTPGRVNRAPYTALETICSVLSFPKSVPVWNSGAADPGFHSFHAYSTAIQQPQCYLSKQLHYG